MNPVEMTEKNHRRGEIFNADQTQMFLLSFPTPLEWIHRFSSYQMSDDGLDFTSQDENTIYTEKILTSDSFRITEF